MADNKNKKSSAPRKRKELKKIDKGQVHIQSTFNNTLVTITDTNGNAVSWSSAGQRIRDPRAFRVRFGDHLDLRRFSHPSQRLQTA